MLISLRDSQLQKNLPVIYQKEVFKLSFFLPWFLYVYKKPWQWTWILDVLLQIYRWGPNVEHPTRKIGIEDHEWRNRLRKGNSYPSWTLTKIGYLMSFFSPGNKGTKIIHSKTKPTVVLSERNDRPTSFVRKTPSIHRTQLSVGDPRFLSEGCSLSSVPGVRVLEFLYLRRLLTSLEPSPKKGWGRRSTLVSDQLWN